MDVEKILQALNVEEEQRTEVSGKLEDLIAEDEAARKAALQEAVDKEVAGLKANRKKVFEELETFKSIGSKAELADYKAKAEKAEKLAEKLAAMEREAETKEQGLDSEAVEARAQEIAKGLTKKALEKSQEQTQPRIKQAEERAAALEETAKELEKRLERQVLRHEWYRNFGQDVDPERWKQLEYELAPQTAVQKHESLTEDQKWWQIDDQRQSYPVAVVDPTDGRTPQMTGNGFKTLGELHKEMTSSPKFSWLFRQRGEGSGFESIPPGPRPTTPVDTTQTSAEQEIEAFLSH